MRAVLRDLETGETKLSVHDVSAFQWHSNNWSCDCNRRYTFKPFGEWDAGSIPHASDSASR